MYCYCMISQLKDNFTFFNKNSRFGYQTSGTATIACHDANLQALCPKSSFFWFSFLSIENRCLQWIALNFTYFPVRHLERQSGKVQQKKLLSKITVDIFMYNFFGGRFS